jgi:hypothetical protein
MQLLDAVCVTDVTEIVAGDEVTDDPPDVAVRVTV